MNRRRRAPKRRQRTRRYNRRAKRRRTTGPLRLMNGNPNRAYIALEYGFWAYTSVGASPNVLVYKVVSSNNPLWVVEPVGSAGHVLQNPQGFDQWATMYKFYRVCGIKLSWRVNPIQSANTAITTRMYWNNDTTYQANMITETQNKYTKIRDLSGELRGIRQSTYIKPWRPLGMTRTEYMTDTTTRDLCTNNTDPTLVCKGWLVIRNLGSIAWSFHQHIRMRILYEFSFPNTLADV